MCVGVWGERERTSGLSQNERGFLGVGVGGSSFFSCNGPCAPKEKWHQKEHIIIIIVIFAKTARHSPLFSFPLAGIASIRVKPA